MDVAVPFKLTLDVAFKSIGDSEGIREELKKDVHRCRHCCQNRYKACQSNEAARGKCAGRHVHRKRGGATRRKSLDLARS